jgi:hypothetical protein
MKISNLSPKAIKNIYISLGLAVMPIGVIFGKLEKGLYFFAVVGVPNSPLLCLLTNNNRLNNKYHFI